MPGQKILIEINSRARQSAKKLNNDKPVDPFADLYSAYDGIKSPVLNSKTKLSKDLNRLSHIYIRNQQGYYYDCLPEILALGIKGFEQNKEYIKQFLTNGDSVLADKIEGLCQDIGNSALLGFMRNFSLKIAGEEFGYNMFLKSRQTQNLVKVADKQFRFDYTAVQYFFQTMDEEMNPIVYYKDLQGNLKKCPLEDLSKIGEPTLVKTKEGHVASDGSVTLTLPDGSVLECLPLMKTNITANLKFNENHESIVDLQYAFETYTPELHYKGPEDRILAPGFIYNQEKSAELEPTPLALETRFLALETKKAFEALDRLMGMALPLQNPKKHAFIQKVRQFKYLKNKKPHEETELFVDFFVLLKSDNTPKTGFLNGIVDFFGDGTEEYKNRKRTAINKWEKIILACPYKKRADLLLNMKKSLADIKPISRWQRFLGFFGSSAIALEVDHPKLVIPKVLLDNKAPKVSKQSNSKKAAAEVLGDHASPTQAVSEAEDINFSGKKVSDGRFVQLIQKFKNDFQIKYQKEIENKKIKLDNLTGNNNQKPTGLQIVVQHAKGRAQDVIQHNLTVEQRLETTVTRDPEYQSIAIVFRLNADAKALKLHACDDPSSLIKVFKAAKFSNREIIFADSDLKILEKLPEYNQIKNLNPHDFNEYLKDKREQSLFSEVFTINAVEPVSEAVLLRKPRP